MHRWLVVFIAVIGFALSAQAEADGVQREWRGGVEFVRSPEEPTDSSQTWKTREMWRIGTDEENEDYLFGVLNDLEVDEDGNVYLLDMQLAEITVFSPDGEYIRSFGGEGEGPGEFQEPRNLLFTPSGKLCVVQPVAHRCSLLTKEGEYLGEMPLPEPLGATSWMLVNPRTAAGGIYWQSFETQFGKDEMLQTDRLIRTNEVGDEICEYSRVRRHIDFANLTVREWETNPIRWNVDPNGRVHVNSGYGYEIEVWSPEGELEQKLSRKFARKRRSAAERDVARARLLRGRGMDKMKIEVSDFDRDINWMDVQGWIGPVVHASDSSSVGESTGFGALDFFDAEGRYAHRVTLEDVDFEWKQDRATLIGDRLFVLKNFADARRSIGAGYAGSSDRESLDAREPEPMSVICYLIDTDETQSH